LESKEVDNLLLEFDEHRKAIKEMIKELDSIKKKIDKLIPTSLDARYIRFFEEKVKSITNLFNSLLEMRKEIVKSVREEIDLRRKLETKGGIEEIENIIDIRKVAQKVESFQEKQREFKENIVRKNLEDYEGIEIPGVNTSVK